MNYLVAGLGNVGERYKMTRHNAGFMVLDHIAGRHRAEFNVNRLAYTAEVSYKSRRLYLIKPLDYMNQSGKAVAYWLHKLAIPQSNLLIVVDDIAIPFGRLRLRGGGRHGGHNGLAHIEELLQSDNYARLRVGIGNDFAKGGQVDYVLGSFNIEEQKALPGLMERAEEIVYAFCFIGIERTMSAFNK